VLRRPVELAVDFCLPEFYHLTGSSQAGTRQSVPMKSDILQLVEERVTPAPPRLEPIAPNSGNRLKTKSFTSLQDVG